jgi:hypothetical protein
VATCALWAPACSVELFKQTYAPALASGRIGRFALFTLNDRAEQDDSCANIYNKSLLYLVSNAFEAQPRVPLFRDGVPILGMERFIRADQELTRTLGRKPAEWVLAPNNEPLGGGRASRSTSHGGFDDDEATLRATLARVIGESSTERLKIRASAESLRSQRVGIDLQTSIASRWVTDGDRVKAVSGAKR